MFYKVAPFLGGMKKVILEVKTDAEVDAIRKMQVKVAIPDDNSEGKFMNVQIPLLSYDVRAMIDNMIFLACNGHKKMFEGRVPQQTIDN